MSPLNTLLHVVNDFAFWIILLMLASVFWLMHLFSEHYRRKHQRMLEEIRAQMFFRSTTIFTTENDDSFHETEEGENSTMAAKSADSDLLSLFPGINWHEPVPVQVLGDGTEHYCCRVCICLRGMTAAEARTWPTSRDECERHIRTAHPAVIPN